MSAAQSPVPAVVQHTAGPGPICCGDCHDIAQRLISDLHAILAHHNLTVDIRVVSDEQLADQCITRIDRAAQAARPLEGQRVTNRLTLEKAETQDRTVHAGPFALTPAIDETYWTYRVRLTDVQAIVGFPKFGTVGIGFAQEEDWNTNLPYTCGTEAIYEHIRHNAADDSITREDCLTAISMIQEAATADRAEVSS